MSVFELFSSLYVKTQNTMKKDGALQSEIFLLHSFSVNDFPFLIILERRPLYDTLRKYIALDFCLFVCLYCVVMYSLILILLSYLSISFPDRLRMNLVYRLFHHLSVVN